MILLAVKDSSSRNLLKDILAKEGHKCLTVESVKKGIKLLETETSIDLVIEGNCLESKTKYELLKYIKQTPLYRFLPVLISCNDCTQEDIVECSRLGADNVIGMPPREDILIKKINDALANGKRTVLIVDDEPEILDILEMTIELGRFKVLTAGSAEEGLEIFRKNTVHAVVTDILMPGMTGLEFMVKIKEESENTPVILITGHSGKYTPEQAIAEGADGYFTKPFKNMELLSTLRKVISSRTTAACNK